MNDDVRSEMESGEAWESGQALHDEAPPEVSVPRPRWWPAVATSVALIAVGAVLAVLGLGKLSEASDDRDQRDDLIARAALSERAAEGLAGDASGNEAEDVRLHAERAALEADSASLAAAADELKDAAAQERSEAAARDADAEQATTAALEVDGLLAFLHAGLEEFVRSGNGLTVVLEDAADRANHRDVEGMITMLDGRREQRLGALSSGSEVSLQRWADLLAILADRGYGSAGGPLWMDDFSDTATGWAQSGAADGSATYGGGVYRIEAPIGSLVLAAAPGGVGNLEFNVDITVDPQLPESALVGAACRISEDGLSGYLFSVDGTGRHQIGVVVDGAHEVLVVGEGASIDMTEPLSLSITCDGDELSMVVNGEVSAKVVDGRHLYGRVGLFVSAEGDSVSAAFDDATLSIPSLGGEGL